MQWVFSQESQKQTSNACHNFSNQWLGCIANCDISDLGLRPRESPSRTNLPQNRFTLGRLTVLDITRLDRKHLCTVNDILHGEHHYRPISVPFCTSQPRGTVGHHPSFGPTASVNKQVSFHVSMLWYHCGYLISLRTNQTEGGLIHVDSGVRFYSQSLMLNTMFLTTNN